MGCRSSTSFDSSDMLNDRSRCASEKVVGCAVSDCMKVEIGVDGWIPLKAVTGAMLPLEGDGE